MNALPLLLLDFYKTTHHEQYPKGMTKLVSYLTPRMSRLKSEDKLIMFGLQGFIKTYLINYFNKNFFERPLEEVINEYERVLNATLGKGAFNTQKIIDLHNLGYLPLSIKAVPEGTRVPIKVPMIEISNTHKDYAWLVNTIESLMSAEMWHPMVSANVGYRYRQIVNKYYGISVDDNVPRAKALGDFSFRGQESLQSAVKSSSAFCLSFLNTATVPAIMYLEDNYNCDCTTEDVAYGSISTEHSVMCSNYAVDGDEISFVRRLLTEIYPNHSFSMVSDSYDYWNLLDNILPRLKKEINEHNGTLLVRGDSGDPVEIICGIEIDEDEELQNEYDILEYYRELSFDSNIQETEIHYCKINDKYYKVKIEPEWSSERGGHTDKNYYFVDNYNIYYNEYELTPADKGTVELLFEHFGGTINSKGYKVLNPKIKAVYGDSITTERCNEIYRRLIKKGFACNNVSLGVGSFSMQCLEENGELKPFTRDTYSIAVKSTYGEVNGEPIMILKQPKTDTGNFKTSQKGMIHVYRDENGEITYKDGYYKGMIDTCDVKLSDMNMLETVFENGKLIKEQTLSEIRNRLHLENGGF